MTDTRNLALKEDELKLTKTDVLEMIEGMIKGAKKSDRWGKNIVAKDLYIATLASFKLTTSILPESFIKMFWSDVLKFISKLLILNQTIKEKQNGDNTLSKIFKKTIEDVKEGNF